MKAIFGFGQYRSAVNPGFGVLLQDWSRYDDAGMTIAVSGRARVIGNAVRLLLHLKTLHRRGRFERQSIVR